MADDQALWRCKNAIGAAQRRNPIIHASCVLTLKARSAALTTWHTSISLKWHALPASSIASVRAFSYQELKLKYTMWSIELYRTIFLIFNKLHFCRYQRAELRRMHSWLPKIVCLQPRLQFQWADIRQWRGAQVPSDLEAICQWVYQKLMLLYSIFTYRQ